MVRVFQEVKRVLRNDGTVWLNYGDTYAGSGAGGGEGGKGNEHGQHDAVASMGRVTTKVDLPSGNLVGVPWRVALALQADGWILRQDIIWCLSGGAVVYARTQKGDMPTLIKDLVRLKPETVQLWNGRRWTRVLSFHESRPTLDRETRKSQSDVRRRKRYEGKHVKVVGDIEIEFRSGERVACSPGHVWPTTMGLVKASDLSVGDRVASAKLPPPDNPLNPSSLEDSKIGWVVGFYLAEGHLHKDSMVQFSVHAEEVKEFSKVKEVAESLGNTCSFRRSIGKSASISVYGKLFEALVKEYVSGDTCYNKRMTTKSWQRSDAFLRAVIEGYLDGDGHYDARNDRWRIGFCNNDGLASDLRTLSARLDCRIRLKRTIHTANDQMFPGWRGEWRFSERTHGYDQGEIVALRAARSKKFWDIEVEDAPNTFSLASGILTHNSKPSPMPESVQNRCCKAHEYLFLLSKSMGYFYDIEAIKEPVTSDPETIKRGVIQAQKKKAEGTARSQMPEAAGMAAFTDGWSLKVEPYAPINKNRRSVWVISGGGYSGAHFATFPEKLIEPCILAGTSEKGACARCGAPYRRVVEQRQLSRERPNEYVKRVPENSDHGKVSTCANTVAGVDRRMGWEKTCHCSTDEVIPCLVCDPFMGSGTTAAVCIAHGRRAWGIDLSEEYLRKNAIPRVTGAILARPGMAHLAGKKTKRVSL